MDTSISDLGGGTPLPAFAKTAVGRVVPNPSQKTQAYLLEDTLYIRIDTVYVHVRSNQ